MLTLCPQHVALLEVLKPASSGRIASCSCSPVLRGETGYPERQYATKK